MEKFFLSVGLLALINGGASAEIFKTGPGSGFEVSVTNSPNTASVVVDLDGNPFSAFSPFGQFVFIGDNNTELQINVAPGSVRDSEWIVFTYRPAAFIGSGNLAASNVNWSVLEEGIQTTSNVKLISVLDQFQSRAGADLLSPLNASNSAFPGFSLIGENIPQNVNPLGFYWWGKTGLNIPFPQGQVSALGAFLDPFGKLEDFGVDPANVYGFTQALEFVPIGGVRSGPLGDPPTGAPATPEPSTWAMMVIGFGLTGWLGLRRHKMAAKLVQS